LYIYRSAMQFTTNFVIYVLSQIIVEIKQTYIVNTRQRGSFKFINERSE